MPTTSLLTQSTSTVSLSATPTLTGHAHSTKNTSKAVKILTSKCSEIWIINEYCKYTSFVFHNCSISCLVILLLLWSFNGLSFCPLPLSPSSSWLSLPALPHFQMLYAFPFSVCVCVAIFSFVCLHLSLLCHDVMVISRPITFELCWDEREGEGEGNNWIHYEYMLGRELLTQECLI